MALDETDLEVRRPDLLLARIARVLPFDHPRTLLALTSQRGTRLQGVTELWLEPPEDDLERSHLVEQALDRLEVSRFGPRTEPARWPVVVAVVVRPGRVWPEHDEQDVLWGLRYGRNGYDVLHGEVVTVTPKGWMTWPDEAFGSWPRASWDIAACTAADLVLP